MHLQEFWCAREVINTRRDVTYSISARTVPAYCGMCKTDISQLQGGAAAE